MRRVELSADEDLVIEGTIAHHKKNLTIGSKGSTVNGDIYCARLVLQDGARFNGKVAMEKQSPLKIAPKAESHDDSNTDTERNISA